MTEPSMIRIHVALAKVGVGSRRYCENLIAAGRVLVDGTQAQIGQKISLDHPPQISVDGKTIALIPESSVYFLVNKPVGVVSTTADERGRPTVLSLVPASITRQYRLYPVGRLDADSEGLVLLTTDGALTQRLTHPKYGVPKTYHVRLDRNPSQKAAAHLTRGVTLTDGFAKPSQVERVNTENEGVWYAITLKEGRNRQVRRMFERIGYPVSQLIRVQLGPWSLDDLDGDTYKQVELPSSLQDSRS